MKTFLKNLMLFAVLSMFVIISNSCKDNEPSSKNALLDNVSYSVCDNKAKENISSDEYIHFIATNKSTLRVEQGLLLNCACDSVNTKISSNKNDISIDIYSYGQSANCICPSTLNYDISNLKEGNSYSFIFKLDGKTMYTTSITFSENLNITTTL